MDRMSRSQINLNNIHTIRCNIKGPLFCQVCESCKLVQKVNLTKAWFSPLSFNSKRMFLEQLILLSDDIHEKIPGILSCLQSKDFQYSNSRHQCLSEDSKHRIDRIDENTNHSLKIEEVSFLLMLIKAL